jgi:osmotically-inducible protein OsmY
MNNTDTRLKEDVEQELRWDPSLNAARVVVSVDAGNVTLLGTVDTFAEKWAAERATKRVGRCRSVKQELKVKLRSEHEREDLALGKATQNVLDWDVFVPKGVTAKAKDGWISLAGTVTWNFQREAAERAMQHTVGVTGISNGIVLKSHDAVPSQVRAEVEAALLRQASADAASIKVTEAGGKITLTGYASSWQAIEDATAAAWSAAGVNEVVASVDMKMTN